MNEFKDLVENLCKDGKEIIATLTPEKAHLWHMATGVGNEIFELEQADINADRENVIEELGDLEFFMEGLRTGTGIERNDVLGKGWTLPIDVTDVVKKHVVYNKDLDLQALLAGLGQVEQMMEVIRNNYKLNREETLQHCIIKLNGRYSSGEYTDKQAQDRADKNQ
jgi:hypothetical protein